MLAKPVIRLSLSRPETLALQRAADAGLAAISVFADDLMRRPNLDDAQAGVRVVGVAHDGEIELTKARADALLEVAERGLALIHRINLIRDMSTAERAVGALREALAPLRRGGPGTGSAKRSAKERGTRRDRRIASGLKTPAR